MMSVSGVTIVTLSARQCNGGESVSCVIIKVLMVLTVNNSLNTTSYMRFTCTLAV